VLGVGSGDMPREFQQLGLAYPPARERQAALEEVLRILRPPPVQQPYVPLLVAGGGERTTLRFAARYADASNLAAAAWAGGAYTPDDARRKLAVLRRHLEEAGRPDEAVLRTTAVVLRLAETGGAARAKLDQLPAGLLGFFERMPLAGTPEEAAAQLRGLVAAGFRYIILGGGADLETLRLAAERVLPAVAGG
jgi:alkanesulfonate monooxygenase SsuD/methylene tetrahydromethanopterin reductase-like flavin-dependent oxidoreductase (luciferase family)